MCTVSFIYTNGTAIVTSNRDEKVLRPSAIPPQEYIINNKKIVFPKDPHAGGTWYAVAHDGTIIVLLNGAEEKHQLKESYRKSRGLIVLDVISSDSAIEEWKKIDLHGIEPFTLVVFQSGELFQLRWNEIEKQTVLLDPKENHIWSSSTLYSKDIRDQRKLWFNNFIEVNQELDSQKMVYFHTNTNAENTENGLVINRNDLLKTLSVTQTVVENNNIKISYLDLQTQKQTVLVIK